MHTRSMQAVLDQGDVYILPGRNMTVGGFDCYRVQPGNHLWHGGPILSHHNEAFFLSTAFYADRYADRFLAFGTEFLTRKPLHLFKMNAFNLGKLYKEGDNLTKQAVAGVTGYGIAPGQAYDRYREYGKPRIRRYDWPRIEIYTEGYLSAENGRQAIYAAKRLALQMQSMLSGLGFDGWIGLGNIRASVAGALGVHRFHEEVLLWDAFSQSKIGILGGWQLPRFPRSECLYHTAMP